MEDFKMLLIGLGIPFMFIIAMFIGAYYDSNHIVNNVHKIKTVKYVSHICPTSNTCEVVAKIYF